MATLPSTSTSQNSLGNIYVVETGTNENGSWIKYNDGLLIQWGLADCAPDARSTKNYFPTPFRTTNIAMAGTCINFNVDIFVRLQAIDNKSFTADDNTEGGYWKDHVTYIAIGY